MNREQFEQEIKDLFANATGDYTPSEAEVEIVNNQLPLLIEEFCPRIHSAAGVVHTMMDRWGFPDKHEHPGRFQTEFQDVLTFIEQVLKRGTEQVKNISTYAMQQVKRAKAAEANNQLHLKARHTITEAFRNNTLETSEILNSVSFALDSKLADSYRTLRWKVEEVGARMRYQFGQAINAHHELKQLWSTGIPPVEDGKREYFLVTCETPKGKRYVRAAFYANNYWLNWHDDHDPEDGSDGKHWTGWMEDKEDTVGDEVVMELENEVLAWMQPPQEYQEFVPRVELDRQLEAMTNEGGLVS